MQVLLSLAWPATAAEEPSRGTWGAPVLGASVAGAPGEQGHRPPPPSASRRAACGPSTPSCVPIPLQPAQVLEDIGLVWRNARLYNHNNPPILEATDRCQQLFERQWRAAGLPGQAGQGTQATQPPAAAAPAAGAGGEGAAPAAGKPAADQPSDGAALGAEWELRRGASLFAPPLQFTSTLHCCWATLHLVLPHLPALTLLHLA